jgi:hypothetical protein
VSSAYQTPSRTPISPSYGTPHPVPSAYSVRFTGHSREGGNPEICTAPWTDKTMCTSWQASGMARSTSASPATSSSVFGSISTTCWKVLPVGTMYTSCLLRSIP